MAASSIVLWLNGRRVEIHLVIPRRRLDQPERCGCPCGKTAIGTFPELRTAGWRWSAYQKAMICGECFSGLVRA